MQKVQKPERHLDAAIAAIDAALDDYDTSASAQRLRRDRRQYARQLRQLRPIAAPAPWAPLTPEQRRQLVSAQRHGA